MDPGRFRDLRTLVKDHPQPAARLLGATPQRPARAVLATQHHVQSYISSSHPHITAEWHVRWKTAALDNIRAAIPPDMCRPGEHLVPEQESRDRITQPTPPSAAGKQPWNRPPTSPPGGHNWDGVIRTARRQLAESQHWWHFYQRAVGEDLEWRRTQQASPAPALPTPAP